MPLFLLLFSNNSGHTPRELRLLADDEDDVEALKLFAVVVDACGDAKLFEDEKEESFGEDKADLPVAVVAVAVVAFVVGVVFVVTVLLLSLMVSLRCC